MSKTALDFYVIQAKKKYIKVSRKRVVIDKNIFKYEADTIIYSVFSQIFLNFRKLKYPPRAKKIIFLLKNLKSNTKKKMTLGKCIFYGYRDKIVVTKEIRVGKLKKG